MGKERALGLFSIFIAAVSLSLGIWYLDGAMIALSFIAVIFSIVSFKRCSGSVSKYSMTMSATILVCTALMVTVASYSTLVEGGKISDYSWVYVSAVIHGFAIIPLIVMFFFTTAALFNASYNWVLTPGLGWLVGTGFQVPKYILVFVIQFSDFENGIIVNSTLVISMFVNLIMFIVFCLILRYIFKKNRYLITAKGLVVRE